MKLVFIAILSYLIGSFSSSYFLGKIKDIDIREHGSGNAGSTNALRVLGKKYAAITFLLDFLKGLLAVKIASYTMGSNGMAVASFFVVMGHNYPFYLKFQGGKGVATSIGVLYSIDFRVGIICTIVGLVMVALTKYVSVGSLSGAIVAPIVLNLISKPTRNINLVIIVLAIFVLIRHRSNIDRLLKGVENKLKL